VNPWFGPLIFVIGVFCGRSVWFMRKCRQLNLAEARANAAATSTATATGVVIVQGAQPDDRLGLAEPGGLAAVPSDLGRAGAGRALVHGGEVTDVVVLDAEVVEAPAC
jgi:hypothetical protein